MRTTEPLNPGHGETETNQAVDIILRILSVMALLFVFLVGIKILTSGIKFMGGGPRLVGGSRGALQHHGAAK